MDFQGFFGKIAANVIEIFLNEFDSFFSNSLAMATSSGERGLGLKPWEDFMANVDGTLSTEVSLQTGQVIRPFFLVEVGLSVFKPTFKRMTIGAS